MDRTSVDPDDLTRLSAACAQLGADIGARCQPDPALATGVPDGYGKVGAALVASVEHYEATLQASGRQLSARYDQHSADLRAAGSSYADTDSGSGDELRTASV